MVKRKGAEPRGGPRTRRGKGETGSREGEPAFSLADDEDDEGFFIPRAKAAVSLLVERLGDPERLEGLSPREALELARELMKEIRLQEEHERGGPEGEEREGTSARELQALDKRLRQELKKKGYL